MVLWVCDVCGNESRERIPIAQVWAGPIYRPGPRGEPKKWQSPRYQLDICWPCFADLAEWLHKRGDYFRPGRHPKCDYPGCVDPAPSPKRRYTEPTARRAYYHIRLYRQQVRWSAYDFAGHLCERHLDSLRFRTRPREPWRDSDARLRSGAQTALRAAQRVR